MKKVMVFGTFDNLHPGHQYFFEQAKRHGDFLIVVVSRDLTVRMLKKKNPLQNESERLRQVQNDKNVDMAVLGSLGDKYEVVRTFCPDTICLGYDQIFFTGQLHTYFPTIRMYRIPAYLPKMYKSSLINKNHNL